MELQAPGTDTPWQPLSVEQLNGHLSGVPVRWWVSGGVALERFLGRAVHPQTDLDISTLRSGLPAVVAALPSSMTAWTPLEGHLVPLAQAPEDADVQSVQIHDAGAWVLEIHVEDGNETHWTYRRDARLQLLWEHVVLNLNDVPVGAPQVQLLWKALRPNADDDRDREAVLPALDAEQVAWLDRAVLTIHPHSSWAIQTRSPIAPGRPSWTRR